MIFILHMILLFMLNIKLISYIYCIIIIWKIIVIIIIIIMNHYIFYKKMDYNYNIYRNNLKIINK